MTYTQECLDIFIVSGESVNTPVLTPLVFKNDKLLSVPLDIADYIGDPNSRLIGSRGPSLNSMNKREIMVFALYVRKFGGCNYYPRKKEIYVNNRMFKATDALRLMAKKLTENGQDACAADLRTYKVV
jgi:hypothetical protein